MIDYVIVSTIGSAIRDQSEHSVSEVILFVSYVVLAVAAIVTAATLSAMHKADTSSITLAAISPCVYFMLLPFGVLQRSNA